MLNNRTHPRFSERKELSLTKIVMNNISTDYVTVQIFPITQLSFIVQGSCLLDVIVLVIEWIQDSLQRKKNRIYLVGP